MSWRKKTTVKFWGVVVVLCLVAALAAMGLNRFIKSFYSYAPGSYEPKDPPREEYIERGKK